MSRKRCHRRPVAPMPPRGLRPRLPTDQVLDLQLMHISNLDLIATGLAEPQLVWDWVEQVLTWSRVAEMMGRGGPEMVEQIELTERMIRRFTRTGAVRFDGPDYQLAKAGIEVMDELARSVDQVTAFAATEWALAQVHLIEARVRAEVATKEGMAA